MPWLVGAALGCVDDAREEWAAHDLTTPEGVDIEVKSSAFLQSWESKSEPKPSFDISPSKTWSAEAGWSKETKRNADLYVFGLFARTERVGADPLDVAQWQFWCVPTATINQQFPAQKRVSLSVLQRRLGEPVPYSNLAAAVRNAT